MHIPETSTRSRTLSKAPMPLRGTLPVPGDKSISHRAVMLGALAEGRTRITGFLAGADCLSTIRCFRDMGIRIDRESDTVTIYGKGLDGLSAPSSTLDCGNSGTTTRLLSGLLAGQSFSSCLTGDSSIRRRPMDRVIDPLSRMGASIQSLSKNGCAPLSITPSRLHGIDYLSPVASAQVKSAILLAGLYADGPTSVTEPALSRNHTELMLRGFGARVSQQGLTASVEPRPHLTGMDLAVPGDISSAAYFLAAASLIAGSEVLLQRVGINPTRDGILRVLREMGGRTELLNRSQICGEETADILVRHSSLHGITIQGSMIPTLIDEIPIIAVLAAFAEGETVIRDASELKVKESNRIDIMVDNLTRMGVDIEATDDGMIIRGGGPVTGARIHTHGDHRIAMSLSICALLARGETLIDDTDCVTISYPGFYSDLDLLTGRRQS